MKQLFIIPTANGAYPTSTTLLKGQLMFYKSDAPNTVVSTAPAATDKEICFAYSRGENSSLITGVIDLNSLTVIKMSKAGKATTPAYGKSRWSSVSPIPEKGEWVIVCPTPEKGLNYTITLAKKGVVFNERNLFSVTDTYRAKVKTAADLAKSLADQLNKLAPGLINIKATVTDTNNVTIQGQDYQDYEVVASDDLYGTTVTSTPAVAPMCDKDYVKNLASVCAQNRGFNNVYADGATIYPGYPMEVDADDYLIYNFHFANPRRASRTRDEAIWQDIYVAVPNAAPANTASTGTSSVIETIFASKLIK